MLPFIIAFIFMDYAEYSRVHFNLWMFLIGSLGATYYWCKDKFEQKRDLKIWQEIRNSIRWI